MPYIEGFVAAVPTANKKMNQDSEMANMEMPFDVSRMFWGGFEQVVNE